MPQEVNRKSLRILAWRAGYHGVTGLARALGRSRVTVHRAVANPSRFGPTYRLIIAALAKESQNPTPCSPNP